MNKRREQELLAAAARQAAQQQRALAAQAMMGAGPSLSSVLPGGKRRHGLRLPGQRKHGPRLPGLPGHNRPGKWKRRALITGAIAVAGIGSYEIKKGNNDQVNLANKVENQYFSSIKDSTGCLGRIVVLSSGVQYQQSYVGVDAKFKVLGVQVPVVGNVLGASNVSTIPPHHKMIMFTPLTYKDDRNVESNHQLLAAKPAQSSNSSGYNWVDTSDLDKSVAHPYYYPGGVPSESAAANCTFKANGDATLNGHTAGLSILATDKEINTIVDAGNFQTAH